jgi:hypothetical protein
MIGKQLGTPGTACVDTTQCDVEELIDKRD